MILERNLVNLGNGIRTVASGVVSVGDSAKVYALNFKLKLHM